MRWATASPRQGPISRRCAPARSATATTGWSNGQKLWSTGADKAEYIWLAVRTDPDAKKHAGISVLMVDLRSPGITLRPSVALYGKTFSAQFY